jgi:hypothetical protein
MEDDWRRRLAAVAALVLFGTGCQDCASTDPARDPPPGEMSDAVGRRVLAEGVMYPLGLAIHGEHVLWGDGLDLMRTPTAGGDVEKIATLPDGIRIESIAGMEDALFVGVSGSGVYRLRGDGPAERIATARVPRFLSVDATRVWYLDGGVRSVARDAPGGAPAALSFTLGLDGAMAADDRAIATRRNRFIMLEEKDGSASRQIIRCAGDGTIALDETHVYWGDEDLALLVRVHRQTGDAELVSTDFGLGNTFALGQDAIYLAEITGTVYVIDRVTLRSRPPRGRQRARVRGGRCGAVRDYRGRGCHGTR